MTESLRLWLAHTLPAKSEQWARTGHVSWLEASQRPSRDLSQWLRRSEVGPRFLRLDPFPLTVAGPRRIHTDFRAPVPVKLWFRSYEPAVRRGNSARATMTCWR